MNYDFSRRLTVRVNGEEAGAIIQLLLSHGIEIFVEGTKDDRKAGRLYAAVQTTEAVGSSCDGLYTAAADLQQAGELLWTNGYGELLCIKISGSEEPSDTEQAMKEYYRKHRQNQLLTLVIVAAALLFYLLR